MIPRKLLFTVALVLLGAQAAWAQSDVISVYAGRTRQLRGDIQGVSKTAISIEVNTIKQEVPVNNIERVAFGDEPAGLRSARASIVSGQIENAVKQLKGIDRSTIPRSIITQEVDYYIAYCSAKLALAGSGDKKAAAGLLTAFQTKNTESYHFYEAAQLLGDLAAALGNPKATEYYLQIGKAPWPEYKYRAAVLAGQANLTQEKFAESAKLFDYVVSKAKGNADPKIERQYTFAKLGSAVCSANDGKAAPAIKAIESIIAANDPKDTELFAKAYNALGACHRQGGPDKAKDAALAYLHTHILFYQDSAAHAEALYYLNILWSQIEKADRALAARKLLKSSYGTSVWATKLP